MSVEANNPAHRPNPSRRTTVPHTLFSKPSSLAADEGRDDDIAESRSPRLAMILPAEARELAKETSHSPWLAISADAMPENCDYVYAPDHAEWRLREHALANALLCLSSLNLDFVIISNALTQVPEIGISSIRNNTVFSRNAFRVLRSSGRLPAGARGRVLRILPGPHAAWTLFLEDPNRLEIGEMLIQGADLHLPEQKSKYKRAHSYRNGPPDFRRPPDPRPTVLILPIFMAVGGAERNLLQIMKALKDRFAFVVVTTEPVAPERGSLNHEALKHCEQLFDLGEVAPPSEHMRLIDSIAKTVEPDILFIANGSPWLAENAEKIRARFSGIPIIDQQVYDAKEGWIQHFENPGIRAADRFIAINREIARAFEQRFRLESDRIDLIYHAVDTTQFSLDRRKECEASQDWIRAGIERNLPSSEQGSSHIFGQVARLTAQKRPLDFLELARRRSAEGSQDRFLLVGDGELAGECDAFIERESLHNVQRIPFHDDMSEIYPVLSGLIFTSAFEGLPVALLEALCMGVPILSTAVGDVRPILDEFGGGVTVEAGAGTEELYDAFSTWCSDLSWLQKKAQDAAPRVAKQFNAAAVGERYAQCWDRAWKQLAPHSKTEAQ